MRFKFAYAEKIIQVDIKSTNILGYSTLQMSQDIKCVLQPRLFQSFYCFLGG